MSVGDDTVKSAASEIYEALDAACSSRRIELVALSGGLDSSIIAYLSRQGQTPSGVAVIARDFVSTDLTYCQMASKEIPVPLSICSVDTAEILDCIGETIRVLGNFNEIEIRNSVVMYVAIRWAAENGYRTIATGDGADELFAGYDFLVRAPRERLAGELERISSIMHFPSHAIGKSLGVSVVSPFLDEDVMRIARRMDPMLKVGRGGAGAGGGARGGMYGKWILRKAFEDHIPRRIAWRRKAAMQDGAGTAGLTGLFNSIIDEEAYAEKRKAAEEEDGVIIRSRESMYYYEIFRKNFAPPSEARPSGTCGPVCGGGRGDLEANGGGIGTADLQRRCPYCRYVVGDSRFCRMCAAFPI